MRLKLVQSCKQNRPVRIREQGVQIVFELRQARADSAQNPFAIIGNVNGKGTTILLAAPALEITERFEPIDNGNDILTLKYRLARQP